MKAEDHIKWIRKRDKEHLEILEHIGADNVSNAKRKINAERREFQKTKEQLCQVVDALEVDNWRNAVVRAKSLLDKLEQNRMPKWLLTVSPAWVDAVRPTQYKSWLRFCQEQFLLLVSEMETIAEEDPDYDIDAEIEKVREFYLTNTPGTFVEQVAEFVMSPYDEAEKRGEEKEE